MDKVECNKIHVSVVSEGGGEPELIQDEIINFSTGTLSLNMGSGKTFIVLEYIRRHIEINPEWKFLIVLPHLLIGQWIKEACRYYTPEFVQEYCLFARKKSNVKIDGGKCIYFVTVNILRKDPALHLLFKRIHYKTIFFDEELYPKILPPPVPNNNFRFNYENTHCKDRSIFSADFVWLISATRKLAPRALHHIGSAVSYKIEQYIREKSIVSDSMTNNTVPLDIPVEEYTIEYVSNLSNGYDSLRDRGLMDGLYDILTRNGQKDYLRAKIITLQKDVIKRELTIKEQVEMLNEDGLAARSSTDRLRPSTVQMMIKNVDLLKIMVEGDKKLIKLLQSKEQDDSCPVCLEDYLCDRSKLFLPCCKNSVCDSCLRSVIRVGGFKCPLCRNENFALLVHEHKLMSVSSDVVEEKQYRSFSVEFTYLLNTLVGKSIIVYENIGEDRDLSCDRVKEEIQLHFSRPPLVLGGNNYAIEKTIEVFKNDPTENFLLLKSTFNYGLNLQFADNVVFLNSVRDQIAFKQILGRLLRLGRSKVLKKFFFKPIIK